MIYNVSLVQSDMYNNTSIRLCKGEHIFKYEIVFGTTPYLDILIFLLASQGTTHARVKKTYSRTFILYSNADAYYGTIMDFIARSKHCEIV